jgi:hypothetical protein
VPASCSWHAACRSPAEVTSTARDGAGGEKGLWISSPLYREGQEDQLNALGLLTNAVVLWNTLYMQAALGHLQSEGVASQPEDRARLSPLQHRHLNVLWCYSFALANPVASGKLRPLNIEERDEAA